jgi:hypothetical protein
MIFIGPVRALPFLFFKIPFNIIFSSAHILSNWLLSFKFTNQESAGIISPHACCMSGTSHIPCFDNRENQKMHQLSIQFVN